MAPMLLRVFPGRELRPQPGSAIVSLPAQEMANTGHRRRLARTVDVPVYVLRLHGDAADL